MASALDQDYTTRSSRGAQPATKGPVASTFTSVDHVRPSVAPGFLDVQPSDDDEAARADAFSNVVTPSSVTTPPYWTNSNRLHQRTPSNISAESLPAGAITLRDNENIEDDDRNNACWAKSVEIVDQTVVNGSATNIGAFVVWIIKVETLSVSTGNWFFLAETDCSLGKLHAHSKTVL